MHFLKKILWNVFKVCTLLSKYKVELKFLAMKNQIIILIAAMFLYPVLNAKTIMGKVSDSYTMDPLVGANVIIKGTTNGTVTDTNGEFSIEISSDSVILVFQYIGYVDKEISVKNSIELKVALDPDVQAIEEVVVVGYGIQKKSNCVGAISSVSNRGTRKGRKQKAAYCPPPPIPKSHYIPQNNESYASVNENGYKNPINDPLSTFSIDVDKASYSNVRRFIMNGQQPPTDAVRLEEMINYFNYDYKQPDGKHPFSINYELAECPWNENNKLLHIGLQGQKLETNELPASNIVFLIDVSGSMSSSNKLPLLKKSYKLLVKQLRDKDRIAIVTYAGSSGLVLPSTSGKHKHKINSAIDNLHAGGGTAGARGLQLAYEVAEKNFIKGGNNRIILATDGDFNIGPSSNSEMEKMITEYREKGIFISVTGFGMGNYKDDKMEIIADKGNGNYSYIDNLMEAKKVFINEFSGTLFTIAKDVKIQIEFNPVYVAEYRLIGYENRLLSDEDFDDDTKDAGELGAGHTVTALYEIVPANGENNKMRKLKFQESVISEDAYASQELVYIKFRYKKPDEKVSALLEETVYNTAQDFSESSNNFKFSAAVAGFGMILKGSEYIADCNYEMVIEMAKSAKGRDENGYRSEFINIVELSWQL